MFINCPYCKALVATDPATDLPPARCPRCAATLREPMPTASDVVDTHGATAHDAAMTGDARADAAIPENVSPACKPPQRDQIAVHEADSQGDTDADIGASSSHPAPATPTIASIATRLLKPADAPIATSTSAPLDDGPVDVAQADAAQTRSEPDVTSTPVETTASLGPEPDIGADLAGDTAHSDTGSGLDTQTNATDAQAEATPVVVAATGTTHAEDSAATTQAAAQPAPRTAKTLPSFARTGLASANRGPGWKTIVAIAGLAVLLLLQLLLADRARVAASAQWRPLVSTLCSVLQCSVPPWREPAAFVLLARDVRPHPSIPDALRVTATFRNDARWPQPWPRLQLTLSDVDGHPVAARDFTARQYLGAPPSTPEIASGQRAEIAMDVAEPGLRSVAFDFQLQ
ncbi:MAG: DUF3426 domain-containing protein [Luteimonas sp.]